MGRKESKLAKKPVFMHDKMYNIVPDITTTNRMHGLEETRTIPRKKPLPLTATGKKYEALPNLGEVHAPSRCNNNAALNRPNPCISPDILSQPDVKKPRVPLACLDLKSIQQKIDKAEKKEKKAKKKKSKPAPKQMTAYQEDKTNEQNENNLPLAHIPRPPDNPLDPSKPRRIVRIKQEMFYLGPEKIAEIVSMVTGNQEGFGYLQQTGESDYPNGEEQYGFINPDPFSGYINPADTLPGVMNSEQEMEYFFPGYIHPADTLPGVMNSDQEMGYSFPGYIHPADTLPGVMNSEQEMGYFFPENIHPADTQPGVMNSDQEIGYSFLGYIHAADTLSGVMDSNQEVGYSFPGYIHPADTLPGMMETGQDMEYSREVPGMNSFRSEICSDSLGGFPQIRRTTVTTPENMSGFVKPRTEKDSLVANPLILPESQRQILKCASPEQFKSLYNRSSMNSTHKQRSKKAKQKLLSINSNVTI